MSTTLLSSAVNRWVSNHKRSTTVCKILALLVLTATAFNLAPAFAAGVEIVFTDSQAAVLRADAIAGGPAIISTGDKLMQPFGIVVGKNGEFFVSDTGSLGLLGINRLTGQQRWISRGGMLGVPFGIAAERVKSPEELGAAISRGIARGGPMLIDCPVGELPDPWSLVQVPRNRPRK